MQPFCIVGHIKKYAKVQRMIEDWENAGEVAKYRYRVLCFYDKHGLNATLDAFNISRRTLYRWRAKLKYSKRVVELKPRSSRPITFRASSINPLIIKKIREVREIYPNMGKDKIFHLQEFRDYCNFLHCKIPSISTIGRIIARDPFKMRYSLKRAKIKRVRVQEKRRKPKDYTSPPLQTIAMDSITYRFEGRNHYVLTAIDLNTRVAYAKPLPTKHTKHTARALLEVLEGINKLREKYDEKFPITILSDNGSEFHKEFEALIKEKKLEHLWTYPRSPKQNAHNERFNRTIQESFIQYNQDLLFKDPKRFEEKLREWIEIYNTKIPHKSLNYKTPMQCVVEWQNSMEKKCQR